MLLFAVVFYVLSAWFLMNIFEKAGVQGKWRAWVPVYNFLVFAKRNPEYQFKVTRIGCGLAGYQDKEIAPLFHRAPDNCHFDLAWRPFLGDKKMYWGSF